MTNSGSNFIDTDTLREVSSQSNTRMLNSTKDKHKITVNSRTSLIRMDYMQPCTHTLTHLAIAGLQRTFLDGEASELTIFYS